jgi:hypothetical protein
VSEAYRLLDRFVTEHGGAQHLSRRVPEDDYVELGIRAMEVGATPPVVANWDGSETASVEE